MTIKRQSQHNSKPKDKLTIVRKSPIQEDHISIVTLVREDPASPGESIAEGDSIVVVDETVLGDDDAC